MNTGTQESSRRAGESSAVKTFQFKALLQSTGWVAPAFVQVDNRGIIRHISSSPIDSVAPVEFVNGFAVPGFYNAHSHAFQYAMAGMAEKHEVNAVDDFWSWREAMYACALTINPDEILAVAAMLYAELLKRGYTHVAEFQYLHHDKNGRPYDNRAEMSVSLIAAASIAGIKITLVPVFYQKGGFGKSAEPAQRRFCFESVDQYFGLLDDCSGVVKNLTTANIGFGVHSLRAADADDVVRIARQGPARIPFHIHAAEQLKEVNDCLSFLKKRPVEWLLDNLVVNERFHLIHCTHLTDDEVLRLARSGAHVVLCPGTEANLGDGIFRLTDFAKNSSHWSIGTDSHISLNPLEDLRWLDYTQRLTHHRRNTFADGASVLMRNTHFSGKCAMGLESDDYFEVGQPLDAAVYDGDSPLLNAAAPEDLLSALVYTADSASVIGTIVDGEWIAKRLRHRDEAHILEDFRRAMKNISDRG
ncbi:MAG: formimidoylglutamate deiminase [Bacteroidota bacterium]|nr:formimidoylglutamate deiminase [Bacteroidota bacterium]